MRRFAFHVGLATSLALLGGCSSEDAPPAAMVAACNALAQHSGDISDGLQGKGGARDLQDALDAVVDALPSDQGELDDEAYNAFLFIRGDAVLASSEISSAGRTLNTSLMERLFDGRDVCADAGVDYDF